MTTDVNRLTSGATPAPAAPTTPASSIRGFVEALERLGHDGDRLLAAAKLQRPALADPDAHLPADAYAAIIAAAQRERPTKNLALRVAEATPIGAFPLIDYLITSSSTLGEGLRRLSKYYRLVGSSVPLVMHDDEDPVRLTLDCPVPFVSEYSLALLAGQPRRESGGAVHAEWVSFVHRPEDPADFESSFGCEVRVNAPTNAVAFSRRSLEFVMPRRDPTLLGWLEQQADSAMSSLPARESLVERVRRALASGLVDGDASIEAVARALAMSSRTLQRRLAGECVTFQRLFDAVRRENAERSLRGSVLSIAEIAFLLGYSEPAAFHRAFRRWHGVTPQEYRAGRRERAS
jgi:AraC-like DNA-binding protein